MFKSRKIKNSKKNKNSEKTSFDEEILIWQTFEHPPHNRGFLWHLLAGILLVIAVIWGFQNQAQTFSIAIVVFAVTFLVAHREEPKQITVKISEIGIKIGTKQIPYSKIDSFWVVYEPPHTKKLYLRLRNEIGLDISVELGQQSPSDVRNILSTKLKELEGKEESFTENLAKLFKI